MSSESLQEAVARNSTWINSVITNSKLSSQLTELLSITSLDQKVIIQEGTLDAKYANPKTLRGYKGDWEADTNNPVLSNSSGVVGDIYKVSIGGNIDIGSGSVDYVVGDLIYLSENNWIKISPNQISDIAGLQLALDSLAGALIPQGNWNANINDPDIATGASTGQFWIVSLAGSTDVGGITDWELNDWAVKTETGWAKIDNSDKVISVAGRVGVVTLGITDISGLTTSLAEAVKLTGDQTVAGIKSFTSDFKVADKVISTGDVLSLETGNGGGGSLILNDGADTLVSNFDLLQVKSFLTSTGMSNNFNNSVLRVLAPNPTNNTGLSSLSLATSDASSYGVSLNAWRFGTSGQPKFVLKMHNNSATGLDALIIDTSGNSVFAGTLAASNLIGTNTGDQSLSISGQTLTISGTGSSVTLPTQATGNFVTLDTTQTISGAKTFSAADLLIGTSLTNTVLELLGDTPNILINNSEETDSGIIFADWQSGTTQRAAIKFSSADNKLKFFVNDEVAQRMVIDTSGNVGIGETNPQSLLHISDDTGLGFTMERTGGAPSTYTVENSGARINHNYVGGANGYRWQVEGATKVSILEDGQVGIGTDSPFAKLSVESSYFSSGVCADFKFTGAQGSYYGVTNIKAEVPLYGTGIRITSPTNSGVDNQAMSFYQQTSNVGSISINTSSTSYNTTSDYRLKENREDISDAIERVKELKPTRFNWIKEPEGKKVDGFYAHELAEVIPESVTGEKDALDYEGNPDYQSVDQSKVVPLLAAALQQAISKIEELQKEVENIKKQIIQ
tara:strand:- start:264 stop:2639 length:2376 start_codon:yes stop_codon:yes gene_type:complete